VSLEAHPFGVGEVGLVCSSHARHPTGSPRQNLFSDGFRRSILGNSEALGRRKGPRSKNLGPLLYTQALVDWLLMQAINPTPNQPSLRTNADLRVQPSS
jgi:hypothetical protein